MTANWESMETFTLESATGNNNLYANGRQSIRVRMAIKVLDINNQPVELTEKERLTVTLVNSHGGEALPYTEPQTTAPLDADSGARWDWSIQNIGDYEYYPSSRARPGSDSMPHSQSDETAYMYFYVRTRDASPLTLSARITREDGKEFFSRNLSGGSLTLNPVRPTPYRASDYHMEKTVIEPDRDPKGKGGTRNLDYYRLVLNADRNLQFRDVECSPGGLFGHGGRVGYLLLANMVGYVKPGQKTINYLFRVQHVDPNLRWDARPGDVLFVRAVVEASNRRLLHETRGRTEMLGTSIRALDEYGNTHTLRLRLQPNRLFGDIELV